MMAAQTGRQLRPYGSWQSPISIETIFSQPAPPAFPFRFNGDLYWLQALPEEGGRIALMRWPAGANDGDSAACLTPDPFNIRTKVHEYGGRCFCLYGDRLVFNNFSDGRLYAQSLVDNSAPQPVTVEDARTCGFADLVAVPRLGRIIAVIEQLRSGKENANALAAVKIGASAAVDAEILVSGTDFYACPQVNNDENALLWLEWDHPMMPWDQTRLCAGELLLSASDDQGSLRCSGPDRLVNETECCISQPGFLRDGGIVYAFDSNDADWSNLCNLQPATGERKMLSSLEAEFGEAHWVFGQRRWVETDDGLIFAIATDHQRDSLYLIDEKSAADIRPVYHGAGLGQLCFSGGRIQLVHSADDRAPEIVELELSLPAEPQHWKRVGPPPAAGEMEAAGSVEISRPEPLQCDTSDGESTRGYLYRPQNARFRAPEGTLPPLVVMVHGGPTSRTSRCYQPLKQYYSSLGFAVLDINHRGSTGYGRAYRQRLLGGWGELDVMDIADCIEYLGQQGDIDAEAVFIRGGSAGGYAVLRALTVYPDIFAGGASYYGIGNLITLSEITHKFESCYTDRLIGETFDPDRARHPDSSYRTRSPVFDMDKLTAPLIMFQGSLDKVVPPEVSREVVDLLAERGIEHAYTEYDDEGHGFRNTANRIDSLQKETDFFTTIISGIHS